MGAAAYNRGSAIGAREADGRMPLAHARADREAEKEANARLRAQVATLERDLARARRCIAELRRSRGELVAGARADAARSDSAIRMLTRIAFPGDTR